MLVSAEYQAQPTLQHTRFKVIQAGWAIFFELYEQLTHNTVKLQFFSVCIFLVEASQAGSIG